MKTNSPLPRKILIIIGYGLVIFGFGLILPLVCDTHELGHVLACHALGGTVGGLARWFGDVCPASPRPGTNCLIDGKQVLDSPMLWAGGALMSIAAWMVIALMVRWIVARARGQAASLWAALFLLVWSGLFWVELAGETYHAYAPPTLGQDSTQFVRLTHLNPKVVASVLLTILLISGVVTLLTVYQGARAFWTRAQAEHSARDALSA